MTTPQHGGARPKVREDDQRGKRGTPRPNAGRPPETFRLKLGDTFYVGRSDAQGNGVEPAEAWQVVEITRTHVVFKSNTGDKVRLVR